MEKKGISGQSQEGFVKEVNVIYQRNRGEVNWWGRGRKQTWKDTEKERRGAD